MKSMVSSFFTWSDSIFGSAFSLYEAQLPIKASAQTTRAWMHPFLVLMFDGAGD
jgi:hypothetical protein